MSRFRYYAKSVVHGAIDYSGQSRRQRSRHAGGLVILTYHSFCLKSRPGLFSSQPLDLFEKQIRFLMDKFKLVSLASGLDELKVGTVSDRPMVAITIDDGFQDNYIHAFPILKRYGAPATIFLATDFVDSGRAPWPTQLAEIFERTSLRSMSFPFSADLGSLKARSLACQRIKRSWGVFSHGKRFAMIHELRKHLKVDEAGMYPPLTWDQIREMQSGQISFGSHTVYHSLLPEIDVSAVREEIVESKNRIEQELQLPCLDFAYPNGNHGSREKAILGSEGFRCALTQDAGVNTNESDVQSLFRTEVPSDDPLTTFRARVSQCLNRRS